MGQPWEVELSFLVHLFSLGSLLVSVHYQFLQGGEMFSFHQTEVMPHATTQVGSAKCVNQWVEFSILAHPTRQFFFFGHQFYTEVAICPPVWFPPEQLMCCAHLAVLKFNSDLEW
jgi:hypothetical protein